MSLALCLLFDADSQRRIRQLWARLEDRGVRTLASHTHGRHHPHLSYAVLRSWDLDRVRRRIEQLPAGGPPTLSCQGSLLFPRGRVALAPAVPGEVFARQERVAAAVTDAGADLHKHYRSGGWLPHISIATQATSDQLPVVARTVADVLPLVVRAEQAALIDSGTGELWPLGFIP